MSVRKSGYERLGWSMDRFASALLQSGETLAAFMLALEVTGKVIRGFRSSMSSSNKARIWATIPEYPNYEFSNKGQVKRLGSHPGKYVTPWMDNQGLRVSLYQDGKELKRYVRRLIAEAFMEDFDPSFQVRNKDGNILDNRVQNLEMKQRRARK